MLSIFKFDCTWLLKKNFLPRGTYFGKRALLYRWWIVYQPRWHPQIKGVEKKPPKISKQYQKL